MKKQIAIIGLGLIGGSMAMALRGFEDYELVGVDRDPDTLAFAAAHGVADRLTDAAPAVLSQADVVYLCLHPRGIVRFLEANRDRFKPGALVTDVCGIKTAIVEGAAVLPRLWTSSAATPWQAERPPASSTPTALCSGGPTTSSPPGPGAARPMWPCWSASPGTSAAGTW